MDKDMFNALLEGIQQMGETSKGRKTASRSFDFPDPEVKLIRERLGVSQEKFALGLHHARSCVSCGCA